MTKIDIAALPVTGANAATSAGARRAASVAARAASAHNDFDRVLHRARQGSTRSEAAGQASRTSQRTPTSATAAGTTAAAAPPKAAKALSSAGRATQPERTAGEAAPISPETDSWTSPFGRIRAPRAGSQSSAGATQTPDAHRTGAPAESVTDTSEAPSNPALGAALLTTSLAWSLAGQTQPGHHSVGASDTEVAPASVDTGQGADLTPDGMPASPGALGSVSSATPASALGNPDAGALTATTSGAGTAAASGIPEATAANSTSPAAAPNTLGSVLGAQPSGNTNSATPTDTFAPVADQGAHSDSGADADTNPGANSAAPASAPVTAGTGSAAASATTPAGSAQGTSNSTGTAAGQESSARSANPASPAGSAAPTIAAGPATPVDATTDPEAIPLEPTSPLAGPTDRVEPSTDTDGAERGIVPTTTPTIAGTKPGANTSPGAPARADSDIALPGIIPGTSSDPNETSTAPVIPAGTAGTAKVMPIIATTTRVEAGSGAGISDTAADAATVTSSIATSAVLDSSMGQAGTSGEQPGDRRGEPNAAPVVTPDRNASAEVAASSATNTSNGSTAAATQSGAPVATVPTAPATPPTAPPLASNAPTVPVHQQIIQNISPLLRGVDGTYALMLQLTPANLGSVRVSLQMKNGEVSIAVRAVEGLTRDMLRENLADLRSSLEQFGVKAGSVDVQSGSSQDGNAFADLLGGGEGDTTGQRRRAHPPGSQVGGADEVRPDPSTPGEADAALDLRI